MPLIADCGDVFDTIRAMKGLEGEITPTRLIAAGIGIAVLVGAIVVFGLALSSDRLARVSDALWGVLLTGLAELCTKNRSVAGRSDLVRHTLAEIALVTVDSAAHW